VVDAVSPLVSSLMRRSGARIAETQRALVMREAVTAVQARPTRSAMAATPSRTLQVGCRRVRMTGKEQRVCSPYRRENYRLLHLKWLRLGGEKRA
jgi:hypothetical protein